MVVVALKLWSHKLHRKKVLFYCDNEVSVRAINTSRSCDVQIQRCLREIHTLSGLFSFQVKAVHIAGVSNRICDFLSRFHIADSFKRQFFNEASQFNLKKCDIKANMWEFFV